MPRYLFESTFSGDLDLPAGVGSGAEKTSPVGAVIGANAVLGVTFVLSRLCAIAVLLSTGLGVPASAATIGINGTVLTASADAGDDVLVVSVSGTSLEFVGVAFASVTPGCNAGGGASVSCSWAGITEVRIAMGAGEDVLDLSAVGDLTPPSASKLFEFVVLGESGDDILIGTSGSFNRMWGGLGDDVLIGGGLFNCLNGGPGDDVVVLGECGADEPVFQPAQPVPSNVAEPAALALVLAALGVLTPSRRLRAGVARPRARLPAREAA